MNDTIDQVKTALMDVDYPASKEQLLSAAERRGAADDAMRALRSIPPVDYGNDAEVLSSIDISPANDSGQGSSNPGMRRVHTKPELAQHMKESDPAPIERELGSNKGS